MASIATIAPAQKPAKRPNQSRRWLPFAAAAVMLLIAGFFESASQRAGVDNGYLIDSSKSGERQAVLQAAGEFRVVAANLLWAKAVDHYHHEYLAKGGAWNRNASLLPLLKTITQLDPHFVQAYQIEGSSILPSLGRLDEGRRVLAEGIKNNPNDWELDRDMAMLYAWHDKQPAEALPYAQAGLLHADDDFSRNLMNRLCNTLQRQIAESGSSTTPHG